MMVTLVFTAVASSVLVIASSKPSSADVTTSTSPSYTPLQHELITLSGLSPELFGKAERSYIGQVYTLSIEATLPDVSSDTTYIVWLTDGSRGAARVQLGQLTKQNMQYSLTFTAATNYSAYPFVEISAEKGAVTAPSNSIIHGQFSVSQE